MRPFARLIAPLLAIVAIAAVGASPTLASGDPGARGSSWSQDLSDAWCFDDDPGYLYCFDVKGKAQFVMTSDSTKVSDHQSLHTVVYAGGTQIGESTVVSNDRFVFGADGSQVIQSHEITKAESDGVKCNVQTMVKIVDYELVIDHMSAKPTCF